jgi:hypothetical protein
MSSFPPLTFSGSKAIFDMGGGQKVYLETNTADLKVIINDTNNPYIEQFTMIHRWMTQPSRGYTLMSLSQNSSQRTAYAAATYTMTVSV